MRSASSKILNPDFLLSLSNSKFQLKIYIFLPHFAACMHLLYIHCYQMLNWSLYFTVVRKIWSLITTLNIFLGKSMFGYLKINLLFLWKKMSLLYLYIKNVCTLSQAVSILVKLKYKLEWEMGWTLYHKYGISQSRTRTGKVDLDAIWISEFDPKDLILESFWFLVADAVKCYLEHWRK